MESRRPTDSAFPAPGHNHAACLSDALSRAETAFADRDMRLTDLRRRVFTEIAGSHRAVGAYEVQERLAANGQRLAPISIYRAIEALLAAGIIHRLESRNAFFACHAPHSEAAPPIVLTCDACGRVAEASGDDVSEAVRAAASSCGFKVRNVVVEVAGRCRDCAAAA